MEQLAKPACLVLAVLLVLPFGCASPPGIEDRKPPAATLPSDTRTEIEEKVADMIKAEEETFQLLNAKMDEYQDTLALCEHVSDKGEESLVGATCREKLKTLKSEIERLSGLLRRQP